MNDVKLILLDLDGTLLIKDNEVPKELDEVIHQLNSIGIALGIASGRNYGSIKRIFKETYKEMILVTGNGASIYNNGTNVYLKSFDEGLYKQVLKDALAIENDDIRIQPMADDCILFIKDDPIISQFERFNMPIKVVDDFNQYTKNIIHMSIISKSQKEYDYSTYYKDILNECEFIPSSYGCMDIMPKGITKASGIKALADILGIKTDQIMAIGDAMNDYDMLKTVGIPVAMKNGDTRIKQIAKYVTDKTNRENGCLDFIKNYFDLN